eukprot:1375895-Amorphochlora_amoeboformis.AAC.2
MAAGITWCARINSMARGKSSLKEPSIASADGIEVLPPREGGAANASGKTYPRVQIFKVGCPGAVNAGGILRMEAIDTRSWKDVHP